MKSRLTIRTGPEGNSDKPLEGLLHGGGRSRIRAVGAGNENTFRIPCTRCCTHYCTHPAPESDDIKTPSCAACPSVSRSVFDILAQVPEKYTTESRPAMPIMTHDWAFCRWMALEHGLVAIPTSPFFSAASRAEGLGSGLVRFCFCKKDETIEAAARALANMARQQALGVSRESRVGAVAE